MNAYPAGSESVTCTPVAVDGPRFPACTVNVTCAPTFGVALSTDFKTWMSAVDTGVVVALALSFAAFGSTGLDAVLVAVLRYGPVACTVAVTCKVALWFRSSGPMFHNPVPLL